MIWDTDRLRNVCIDRLMDKFDVLVDGLSKGVGNGNSEAIGLLERLMMPLLTELNAPSENVFQTESKELPPLPMIGDSPISPQIATVTIQGGGELNTTPQQDTERLVGEDSPEWVNYPCKGEDSNDELPSNLLIRAARNPSDHGEIKTYRGKFVDDIQIARAKKRSRQQTVRISTDSPAGQNVKPREPIISRMSEPQPIERMEKPEQHRVSSLQLPRGMTVLPHTPPRVGLVFSEEEES